MPRAYKQTRFSLVFVGALKKQVIVPNVMENIVCQKKLI